MARLTAAARRKIPSKDFVFPGKGKGVGGKGPGSYPVDSPEQARSALRLGGMHAGPEKLAKIKAKVRSKFPGIGKK
jgi:hypothetical protein